MSTYKERNWDTNYGLYGLSDESILFRNIKNETEYILYIAKPQSFDDPVFGVQCDPELEKYYENKITFKYDGKEECSNSYVISLLLDGELTDVNIETKSLGVSAFGTIPIMRKHLRVVGENSTMKDYLAFLMKDGRYEALHKGLVEA
ncbi:hypothetical protein OAG24_01300 [bacterium]|nr:hypothetical protein [bacterium]